MPRVLLAILLFAPLLAAAQPADTLVALPRWHRGVEGDFRPPQTSAVRAYLYSVAATGVPVLIGTAMVLSVPVDAENETERAIQGIGGGLILNGLVIGPIAGHLSLGAGVTAQQILRMEFVALGTGAVISLAGVGLSLTCILSGTPGTECGAIGPATVLLVAGGVVAGVGVAAGAVYSLATIPASARWARRARASGNRVPASQVRVSVAPGYDPRFDAPMATIRVSM